MINFKEYFVSKVKNDTLLASYITDSSGNINIYPNSVDLLPERFPCITFLEVGTTVKSIPRGMYIGILQVDIWSNLNEMEIETIEGRLTQLFNYRDSTQDSLTGTLWWVRVNGEREETVSSRKLWKKSIDLKYWFSNPDNL